MSAARDHVIVQVETSGGKPSLAEAARLIGVSIWALSATKGVIPVDPDKGVWCVSVDADAVPRDPSPFSNPGIATFR
jgi:hypothetical protein